MRTTIRRLTTAGHVRLVEGDGNDEPAGGGTPEGEPETGSTNSGDAPAGEPQDVNSLPEWARKLISDTRSEAASHRRKATDTEAARAKMLTDLGRALGLTKDETPDPERLTKDLESRSSELKAARGELAVLKAAARAGADADTLLDSRAFMDAVGEIDPDADDYTKRVAEKINKFVADNPRFKSTQAPARSGAPMGENAEKEHAPDGMEEFSKRAAAARSRSSLRRSS